ncbi:MAG TPA: 50S ribosomal protein L25, partial [Thermoleophilia bacterium]|nr:50S ribosomal protein L25 [Thermoleophilia bacterium]
TAGMHAVLDVVIEGHKTPHVAIVKEFELDKVKHVVTHVDFQEIKLTEVIESNVTVTLEGTPVGVSLNGGLLDVVTREVTVSALPTDIPEHITLQVEGLDVGDVLHVADLQAPANVTILDDPEAVVCSVLAPRVAEVVGEEGEEAAAAEPEVVGEREAESEE